MYALIIMDDHKSLWMTICVCAIFFVKNDNSTKNGTKNDVTKCVTHTQIGGQNIVFFSAETTCKMQLQGLFVNASDITMMHNYNRKMCHIFCCNIF